MSRYSEILNDILQQNIMIHCNDKVIRQGRLMLITYKDYYITFIIKTKNGMKKYELPYPFRIEEKKRELVLDYKIATLARSQNRVSTISSIERLGNSKLYNNFISIKY